MFAIGIPLLLLLLVALLVRSLRKRRGAELNKSSGAAAVNDMLYANPAYGNNGLVDGAGPVGIYSAIDDEPPDTGADGQPLYAAVDYGVDDSNQCIRK